MSKLWSPQMTDLALAGAVTVLLPVVVLCGLAVDLASGWPPRRTERC